MSAPEPPRLAERLLERFVPPGDFREAFLGDLREDFAATGGGGRAIVHYWLQVLLMLPRLWIDRAALRGVSAVGGREPLVSTLRSDVRFAFRIYVRRRTFAALMLLTIAIGIGSATSMFSLVDGVVLRSLPFPDADRLVSVYRTVPRRRDDPLFRSRRDGIPLAWPEYRGWRDAQTAFDGVAAWLWSVRTISSESGAEQASVLMASASLLDVLRVRPQLGRSFREEDEGWPPTRVALISDGVWRTRYGADPDVLGRSIVMNDEPHRIVGVLPRDLRVPGLPEELPYWVPGGSQARDTLRRDLNYQAIARLPAKGGLTRAETETARLFRFGGAEDDGGARLVGLQEDVTRSVRAPFLLLLIASGLLLLITCVNVAALLLGEGARRESELAARLALGAAPGRLLRQLLTEQLVMAVVGAMFGVLFACWATRTLVALAPEGTPRIAEVVVSWRSYLFAFAAAVATAVTFGLTPAFALVREGTRMATNTMARVSTRRGFLQRIAIGAQVCVTVVLLVGATLLVRSLRQLGREPVGFVPEALVHVQPLFGPDRPGAERQLPYVEQVLEAIRGMPGVRSASVSSSVPFTDGGSGTNVEIEVEGVRRSAVVQWRVAMPDLLRTLGIPLVEGRDISEADGPGAPPVVLVSRTMADRSWPGASALGQRVRIDDEWHEVVGIVGDVKHHSLAGSAPPTLYLPARQTVRAGYGFVLRVNGEPGLVIEEVKRRMREVDPAVAVAGANVVATLIRDTLAPERFRSTIITFFALAAMLLTGAGLYGVTSDAVARRRREMAIRMALGSTDALVARLVVRGTLAVALLGAGVGTVMALGASRVLTPYLYQITGTDAVTYASVLVGTLGLTLFAAWVPARRARSVEVTELLRGE